MKSICRFPFQKVASHYITNQVLKTSQCCRYFSITSFSEDHEWITTNDDNTAVIGITNYAQETLGEIVFVEFPEIGDAFDKGDTFGQIESVKAASELYMPVSGEIVEINHTLMEEPGVINASAEDKGWMIKVNITNSSELADLMDKPNYEAHVENIQ